jgi:hypothetical protein
MATLAVTTQPPVSVLVIIALPAVTPVTVPVDEPTVATAVLLLVQVPAPPVLPSVAEVPWQIALTPVITGINTVALPGVLQQPAADCAVK